MTLSGTVPNVDFFNIQINLFDITVCYGDVLSINATTYEAVDPSHQISVSDETGQSWNEPSLFHNGQGFEWQSNTGVNTEEPIITMEDGGYALGDPLRVLILFIPVIKLRQQYSFSFNVYSCKYVR